MGAKCWKTNGGAGGVEKGSTAGLVYPTVKNNLFLERRPEERRV